MSGQALWYLTRGSGIVAMILLTASVVGGLLTTMRVCGPGWPRFVVEGLHRNVALLAPIFVAVHVTSSVLDTYVPLTWTDAVLPFGAGYRPLWTGLGALALDLFVAVAATSLIRVRLGFRSWKAVHWLAYACWGVALFHALGSGSDRGQPWMVGITASCVASVVLAAAWRVGTATTSRRSGPATGLPPVPVDPAIPEGALR